MTQAADTEKALVTKLSGVTRFHQLSRRPSGIMRQEAVQKAAEVVEELKPNYLEWLEADINRLGATLDLLQRQAIKNPGTMTEAYHHARAIRDIGTTFGHPAITTVADDLCELLYCFSSNGIYSQDAIDTLFSSLLYLRTSENSQENVDVLFEGLEKVVNRFSSPDSET